LKFFALISIIPVQSQIDARSLIQVERNEKALRGIHEKIVRARDTLDWPQSNISCSLCLPSVGEYIDLRNCRFCHMGRNGKFGGTV